MVQLFNKIFLSKLGLLRYSDHSDLFKEQANSENPEEHEPDDIKEP